MPAGWSWAPVSFHQHRGVWWCRPFFFKALGVDTPSVCMGPELSFFQFKFFYSLCSKFTWEWRRNGHSAGSVTHSLKNKCQAVQAIKKKKNNETTQPGPHSSWIKWLLVCPGVNSAKTCKSREVCFVLLCVFLYNWIFGPTFFFFFFNGCGNKSFEAMKKLSFLRDEKWGAVGH